MITVNENFQVEFGERVRIRREEIGMTQDELAEKLNYKHKSSVSKIEKGIAAVPNTKIVAIAKVLDCSVQYLMGREKTVQTGLKSIYPLTEEETRILLLYRKASERDKTIINSVLESYEEETPSHSESSEMVG